jgi:6-phosphogluconate dehydrogenase
MELGMIGLGKMGANMSERLVRGGHRVVGYDRSPDAIAAVVARGGEGAGSLEELVGKLASPRAIWVMVPAGAPVDSTIDLLIPMLAPGDVIIDGGNSNYKDSQRRALYLKEHALEFVDAGTSGGIWGLAEGYSMMVGGSDAAIAHLRPILETLAPAVDRGWGHVGPSGAGHFVKMIHNGIEYGMMQAFAEGFAILKGKEELDLDLHQIAEIWRHGSVVRSWLLDLTARALEGGSDLANVQPFVPDSGEGRWTVAEAIDLDISAPVITLALLQRLRSRDAESYADRMLAVMREQFGGHAVKRDGGTAGRGDGGNGKLP